jgi:hypothetical protein
MVEHCCVDLLPFSHKSIQSISEVRHWCWAFKPGSQSVLKFIPKVFDGVKVRALCRPVKVFHTDLDKSFLYGPRFVHDSVRLKQERAFPKLLPQSWNHRIVQNIIVCYRFPFTETIGPSWKHEKQPQSIIPPPPNFTVGIMHSGT